MVQEVQTESRRKQTYRQVALLVFISIGLLSIVLLAPDAASHRVAFFKPALQTTWSNVFDLPAIWSSIKIILFSIGLFLLIESAGTMLSVLKMRTLAIIVFFLQFMPCLGVIWGGYYLIKSLF